MSQPDASTSTSLPPLVKNHLQPLAATLKDFEDEMKRLGATLEEDYAEIFDNDYHLKKTAWRCSGRDGYYRYRDKLKNFMAYWEDPTRGKTPIEAACSLIEDVVDGRPLSQQQQQQQQQLVPSDRFSKPSDILSNQPREMNPHISAVMEALQYSCRFVEDELASMASTAGLYASFKPGPTTNMWIRLYSETKIVSRIFKELLRKAYEAFSIPFLDIVEVVFSSPFADRDIATSGLTVVTQEGCTFDYQHLHDAFFNSCQVKSPNNVTVGLLSTIADTITTERRENILLVLERFMMPELGKAGVGADEEDNPDGAPQVVSALTRSLTTSHIFPNPGLRLSRPIGTPALVSWAAHAAMVLLPPIHLPAPYPVPLERVLGILVFALLELNTDNCKVGWDRLCYFPFYREQVNKLLDVIGSAHPSELAAAFSRSQAVLRETSGDTNISTVSNSPIAALAASQLEVIWIINHFQGRQRASLATQHTRSRLDRKCHFSGLYYKRNALATARILATIPFADWALESPMVMAVKKNPTGVRGHRRSSFDKCEWFTIYEMVCYMERQRDLNHAVEGAAGRGRRLGYLKSRMGTVRRVANATKLVELFIWYHRLLQIPGGLCGDVVDVILQFYFGFESRIPAPKNFFKKLKVPGATKTK